MSSLSCGDKQKKLGSETSWYSVTRRKRLTCCRVMLVISAWVEVNLDCSYATLFWSSLIIPKQSWTWSRFLSLSSYTRLLTPSLACSAGRSYNNKQIPQSSNPSQILCTDQYKTNYKPNLQAFIILIKPIFEIFMERFNPLRNHSTMLAISMREKFWLCLKFRSL